MPRIHHEGSRTPRSPVQKWPQPGATYSSRAGEEAILRKEGDRLIVEPVRKGRLLALLDTLDPLDETFPDVDEDLAPLDVEEL
jgi:hypothetical protein